METFAFYNSGVFIAMFIFSVCYCFARGPRSMSIYEKLGMGIGIALNVVWAAWWAVDGTHNIVHATVEGYAANSHNHVMGILTGVGFVISPFCLLLLACLWNKYDMGSKLPSCMR